MLECALQWFLLLVVLHLKPSQVAPAMKRSRFYSENKFGKQDTNCQNGLKMCLFMLFQYWYPVIKLVSAETGRLNVKRWTKHAQCLELIVKS